MAELRLISGVGCQKSRYKVLKNIILANIRIFLFFFAVDYYKQQVISKRFSVKCA